MIIKQGTYKKEGNCFYIGKDKFFIQTVYGNRYLKLIEHNGEGLFKHISRLYKLTNNEFKGDDITEGKENKKNFKLTIGYNDIQINELKD